MVQCISGATLWCYLVVASEILVKTAGLPSHGFGENLVPD